MELDKLQIELRPRTNAQALDLGFALLREHAGAVYRSWLALWLPLMALCAVASALLPEWTGWWVLAAWWVRPLLERAPLYVLSRAVFGEPVSPRAALRAWPRQLAGGWFQLMTWGRPIAAGRGLLVPVWQLEGARGKLARARLRALVRDGGGSSAFWFGVVCFQFELVLQLGVITLVGKFLDAGGGANPFSFLFSNGSVADVDLLRVLMLLGASVAGAIVGPIYTACTFALYLNRRARLEAWDIEIVLRQIVAPAARPARALSAMLVPLLLPVLLGAALLQSVPVQARQASAGAAASASVSSKAAADVCDLSELPGIKPLARGADADPAEAKLRREVDALYATEALRGYDCARHWTLKDRSKPNPEPLPPDFTVLAQILRALLIAAALAAVGWLAWRYRDRLPAFKRTRARGATEVAGLDIRASSLPADVPAAVRALWHANERRAALALLYRATLARLVEDDGLQLYVGATEGDCLRLAHAQLRAERSAAVDAATGAWLGAAYGDRWPDDAAVAALCAAWQLQFDARVPTDRAVNP